MEDNIIKLEQVSWRRDKRTILKNVNWSVGRREHWAIVGLNGSGKTTLLNIINGYIWPSKGSVHVLGRQFGKCDLNDLRKSIGWVSSSLQERLYGHYLAYEIVLSGKFASIGLYEQVQEQDVERAMNLLEQLQCTYLSHQPYHLLSQGEKQRVLIARALMASPELLILDEPCTGLDIVAREGLLQTIEQITKQPNAPTLLYVTHHVEEILPIFQHTLLVKDGEIHRSGKTSEVLTSGHLTDCFNIPIEVNWEHERPWIHVSQKRTSDV